MSNHEGECRKRLEVQSEAQGDLERRLLRCLTKIRALPVPGAHHTADQELLLVVLSARRGALVRLLEASVREVEVARHALCVAEAMDGARWRHANAISSPADDTSPPE